MEKAAAATEKALTEARHNLENQKKQNVDLTSSAEKEKQALDKEIGKLQTELEEIRARHEESAKRLAAEQEAGRESSKAAAEQKKQIAFDRFQVVDLAVNLISGAMTAGGPGEWVYLDVAMP